MCTIQSLSGSSDCNSLNGGVKFAYAFPISELTSVTVNTGGVITGFTMATTGQFKKLAPSKGEAMSFVQNGERNGLSLSYSRTGNLVFNGFNANMSKTAQGLSECCEIGIIWFMQNGERVVQGIELDSTVSGGFVVDSRRAARIVPTATSGDNDNSAQISFVIESSGYKLAPFTSLDEAAIIAL